MFIKIKIFGKLVDAMPQEKFFVVNGNHITDYYVENNGVIINTSNSDRKYVFINYESAITFICALTEVVTGGESFIKGGFYKIEALNEYLFAV